MSRITVGGRNQINDDGAILAGRCLVDVRKRRLFDAVHGDAEARRRPTNEHGSRAATIRIAGVRHSSGRPHCRQGGPQRAAALSRVQAYYRLQMLTELFRIAAAARPIAASKICGPS